ncbi:hypothetical protein V6N11_077214 [Hibiscus sabdariffa]|uniref:Secreted protein n=1 Tax=Hibiscus sabdariffa TaxID=183260 RepID=A0ABR2TCU5_9ROSI
MVALSCFVRATFGLGTIGFEWASHCHSSSPTSGSKDLSLAAELNKTGLPDKIRAYSLCLASVFIKQAKRGSCRHVFKMDAYTLFLKSRNMGNRFGRSERGIGSSGEVKIDFRGC